MGPVLVQLDKEPSAKGEAEEANGCAHARQSSTAPAAHRRRRLRACGRWGIYGRCQAIARRRWSSPSGSMPPHSSSTGIWPRGAGAARRFASPAAPSRTKRWDGGPIGSAMRSGARGVDIEQRVLLALPDRPEFAEAFWGAVKLGAVPVPVGEALSADEYAFVLNDSRARAVVAGEGAAEAILSVRAQCPWLAAVIAVGRPRRGALAYERLLERASTELAPRRHEPGRRRRTGAIPRARPGAPKAAVHLHHDLVARGGAGRAGRSSGSAPTTSSSRSRSSTSLRPRQLALLPGARGRRVLARARAPRPRARVFALIDARAADGVLRRPHPVRAHAPGGGRRALRPLLAAALRVVGGGAARRAVRRVEGALRPRAARRGGIDGGAARLHRQPAGRGARRARAAGSSPASRRASSTTTDAPSPPGVVGHLLVKGDSTSPGYWNRHERTRPPCSASGCAPATCSAQDADGYFYFAGAPTTC